MSWTISTTRYKQNETTVAPRATTTILPTNRPSLLPVLYPGDLVSGVLSSTVLTPSLEVFGEQFVGRDSGGDADLHEEVE